MQTLRLIIIAAVAVVLLLASGFIFKTAQAGATERRDGEISAKELHKQGAARYQSGDIPGAIQSYDQAIAIDDQSAKAYGNRGIAHAAIGDTQHAIEDLEIAARIFATKGDWMHYGRVLDILRRLQTPP
jgi:tetratricopeptide (TPR) repeat protein